MWCICRPPIDGRAAPGSSLSWISPAHCTPLPPSLAFKQRRRWNGSWPHEPEPRGWYAGFIGWFNQSGDGELSVSIRSGLLSEDEGDAPRRRGGIVAGSDPSAEYLETAWKQRPFLRALGIELPA